ncbi:MAG: hypothetical protein WCZ11_03730 [Bacilli bacterium]
MWWQEECSLVGLFNELIKDEKTAKYIKFKDDTLSLKFHKSFELKVIYKNGYFNTYINDKFYYDIEEQDIYEYIEEIVNDAYVIVEYNKKNWFHPKRYFELISKERFIMSKVKNAKRKVKRVFTVNNVLFENN